MSAATYINKLRVETIARNTKVEYPGRVAKNIEPLAPACGTTPNFTVLTYTNIHTYCKVKTHACSR